MKDTESLLPLPLPESDDLKQLVPAAEVRRIYSFLYERRDDPPTETEIEDHLAALSGETHSNRGRRRRELSPLFEIQKVPNGRRPRYLLVGMKPSASDAANDPRPSRALRAQVLQVQRCAMCGKTPLKHGVELDVDHKLPRSWGGKTVRENLQPLCQECNAGKKAHFSTFERFESEIRQAASFADPRQRLGELLAAFGKDRWVPSDLLEAVASAKEPQDDWQRRLRELRKLGWNYKHKKRRERGRVRVYYQLTKSATWPDSIPGTIRAAKQRRTQNRDS
ncbi:HNH endonuclease signature motif containing protein [Gordonia sp. N1V]|uniref:HNH endonuclease n=1 Tax=Gordonia sp. N1V TaxID=3034163 RepID=UPI0023E0EA28|nr:HNH endonuclease signature motif containing protein [Gordonia sp. N1V]MDF3285480.1 HNH endonuclease signature motif containing protein [Gordonia sp. N1V]